MYPNGNGQPFQATNSNTQFSYNYNVGGNSGAASAGAAPTGTWNNYGCPPGYSQYNQQQWQQGWNNSGAWSSATGQQVPGQQSQQPAPQQTQQNQQKGCDNYQRTFDYVQQCQNWTNAQ